MTQSMALSTKMEITFTFMILRTFMVIGTQTKFPSSSVTEPTRPSRQMPILKQIKSLTLEPLGPVWIKGEGGGIKKSWQEISLIFGQLYSTPLPFNPNQPLFSLPLKARYSQQTNNLIRWKPPLSFFKLNTNGFARANPIELVLMDSFKIVEGLGLVASPKA